MNARRAAMAAAVVLCACGIALAQGGGYFSAAKEGLFSPTAVYVPEEREERAPVLSGVRVRALRDFQVDIPVDLGGKTEITVGRTSPFSEVGPGFSIWGDDSAGTLRLGFRRRFGRTAFEVGGWTTERGTGGHYARVRREVGSSASIDISRARELSGSNLSLSSLAVRYRPNDRWLLSGDVAEISGGGTRNVYTRVRASYSLSGSLGVSVLWREQGAPGGGRRGLLAGELDFSF